MARVRLEESCKSRQKNSVTSSGIEHATFQTTHLSNRRINNYDSSLSSLAQSVENFSKVLQIQNCDFLENCLNDFGEFWRLSKK
jgi:hypothetical protein